MIRFGKESPEGSERKTFKIETRYDYKAGPSGRKVISLQKVDSLIALVDVREAKKVSAV
jgi:hypothetical protein